MRAAVLAILAGLAGCQPPHDDPDGFRGIAWGTPFDQVKDQFVTEFTGALAGVDRHGEYQRKNEHNAIGDVPLTRIRYRFDNGRFVQAMIDTMADGLVDVLRAQFGEPRHAAAGLWWEGSKTDVLYSCTIDFSICTATISSHAFIQSQAQQRRENIEKARKDL